MKTYKQFLSEKLKEKRKNISTEDYMATLAVEKRKHSELLKRLHDA